MYNQFGTEAVDFKKRTLSDGDDAESYIAKLINDFSRARSVRRYGADGAGDEDDTRREDAEAVSFENNLYDIRTLQEDLKRVKSEREELSRRLEEIEKKNIQSEEDLKSILSEKKEIEERNRVLQSANDEALNKIRILTREKDEAVMGESEALEKYLQQLRDNDDLAAELSNLKTINEKLNEEIEKDCEPESYAGAETAGGESGGGPEGRCGFDNASEDGNFEEIYGEDLVTDSGKELFMMLRGLLQDDARDDNGVRMTRTWEEEVEETIPGAYPDEPAITRKVRTKSEVSVEYLAGRKNDIGWK